MRHYKLLIITAFSSVVLSCTEKAEPERTAITQGVTEITASFADSESKTVLADDEKNILWSPGDEINVFYKSESAKFTSINTEPRLRSVFVTDESVFSDITDDEYFWGTYPYCADNSYDGKSVIISVPDVQTAVEGSFEPNSFAAVGRSKDTRITFYNVCGGIRFSLSNAGIEKISVSGNNNEILAGRVKVDFDGNGHPQVTKVVDGKAVITLIAPEGDFQVGKWYYISTLPAEFSNGITFSFDRFDAIGTKTVTSSFTVKRSTFGSIKEADKNIKFVSVATNLAEEGTANCYVVPQEGIYLFDATAKGSYPKEIECAVSAELLWESYGTNMAPEKGAIIKKVKFINDNVVFETATPLKDGNAVIAVKNEDDEILWSWHIWVCKDYDPLATAQVYNNNAGTLMDRNLGATSATPGDVRALGLLYQWGRKDPFLGSSSIKLSSLAKSTLSSWPASVESNADNGTIEFAVSHPTTFIKSNTLNWDWYYTGSSELERTRWLPMDVEKSIYDPCPEGWRVPDGSFASSVWSIAFGISQPISDGPWDTINYGMNFGSANGHSINHQLGTDTIIWYPAAGNRSRGGGKLYETGSVGYYWTSVPLSSKTCWLLDFYNDGNVYTSDFLPPAYGYSVRCILDELF